MPVTTRTRAIIDIQKFEGAAADLLNANIIARDLGLADKREHGGPDGGPIDINVTIHFIDPDGTRTDKDGHLIDENGNLIKPALGEPAKKVA